MDRQRRERRGAEAEGAAELGADRGCKDGFHDHPTVIVSSRSPPFPTPSFCLW
jgi:hypothetical protein